MMTEDNSTTILFSFDIIIEITKFIDELKDYFNLALINKQMFNLMIKENLISLNEICKRNFISLNDNFPNYLFQLNNLKLRGTQRNINLLKEFTKLKYLNVCNYHEFDLNLQNCKDLEELYILQCKDIFGSRFQDCKKLRILELSGSFYLNDENFNNLQNLTNLSIDNFNNYVYNRVFGKFLQNLPNLTSLRIKIKFFNVNYLNGLINLKLLDIYCDKTSNLQYLQNLVNLETLKICNENITDSDLIYLKNLKHLTIYEINKFINGNCFVYLNKLETINLQNIPNLKEENLQYLQNVTKIKLNNQFPISGKYLSDLINVTDLKLSLNNDYKEEYLQKLLNLKTFSVVNNFAVQCGMTQYN